MPAAAPTPTCCAQRAPAAPCRPARPATAPAQASSPPQPPCGSLRHPRRQRRRAAPPCRLPPPAAATPDAAGYETDNDGQTVEQRLEIVKSMVATSELLVPYDRSAVNLGLILWGAIRNIPHKDRMQLLERLDAGDIKRLWTVAGQRYTAPKQQIAAAIGPEFSIWQDLPRRPGQLALFRGRAALPVEALGISRFGKALFLHPGTDQLYGRVLLGKGPLGDLLYPLYFRAQVGTFVVPTTQEPCDLRLEYLAPEDLGLSKSDLPRGLWPAPKRHLPPFHEGFTDFVRVVAPGVYVGLGYRTASTEKNEPLYFLMVHQKIEDGP